MLYDFDIQINYYYRWYDNNHIELRVNPNRLVALFFNDYSNSFRVMDYFTVFVSPYIHDTIYI